MGAATAGKRTKIAIAAALISAALIAGAAAVIEQATAGRTYDRLQDVPHHRVGLVLGCSRRLSDGRANLFFSKRIQAAVQLFQGGKVDYLLVSGDNRRKEYDETTDMRDALIKEGVPAGRIYCDYAGFRTLDSVLRARSVFSQKELTIVSQRFHNERAIFIALHNGIDAVGFNAAEVDVYNSFKTRCREQLARVRTVLDIYLLRTTPKFGGERIEIGAEPVPAAPETESQNRAKHLLLGCLTPEYHPFLFSAGIQTNS